MLGDDIVDLRDPETQRGALHPRFDSRVFGPRERELLDASGADHLLRWGLWAAKEAAFKALRRRDRRVVFSPPRFEVFLAGSGRGRVQYGAEQLALRLGADGECLHAVAGRAKRAHTRVARLGPGESPGAAARRLARRVGAELLEVPQDRAEVARRGRLPVLLLSGSRAPLVVSLSHHGRFASCAVAFAGGGRG